jgi:immunoglobulin-binding protein 1
MSGDANSNSMPKSMNQEDSLETELADIQKNQRRQQNQNQNRGDGNQAAAAARESEYKETVSKRFDKTYQTFKNFEDMDMSDPNTQNQLSQLIKDLEEITQTISSLDFFSKNESLDEINPAKLKFLLLPYLLASAWQMKRHAERSEVCRICKIYLDDFIERALDFLIISKPPAVWLKSKNLSSDSEEKQSQRSSNSLTPEQKRAQKIEQYRLNKEYDSRIQALTERVEAGEDIDDSTYKELYLTLIKRACVDAEAQLENVLTELEMLAYRAKMMKNGNPNPQPTSRPPQLGPGLPYQTFILTRSEVEKKVFGLGYPSIPAMTVEELYEQRIKDGTWTQGHGGQQGPSTNSAPQQEQDEETQKAEEELLEEIDDMNLRESLRARDEYRDEHRRGWGNRMNRS